ncbi:tRNA (adenosine(37)-N6)-threonylcarbamoyltransferase complex transferase subunit TsaD [Tepidibacillus fermentans]|uniref:tRNA N6-adenosine threonylcarbamoyltransferase n=1 Tax=Tepidibacillus fermentans TaxID=1281767 RepID=A0A4R3K9M7_9BACI|nr:tRNA (adenosine(37)-N6)-threonylcarbamoyltransferase complex transferase subunit TsaD [Tepidibacillus fermentans]TCS79573.1 O-sialoglycoprotein endopeptidase [Tepidibacillus fermentans]
MNKHWNEIIKEKKEKVLSGDLEYPIRILAIETSCDETSVAIVEDGQRILSNVVSSQIDIHKRFGGVVPEVASRKHVEGINYILEEALQEANLSLDEIDAIAVTYGPGLIGALLVGLSAAKAIAFAKGIPLIGVHHIAGHIYANQLVTPMKFPLIALVVSGGHTELVYMRDHLEFEVLGETRDDAAGEAYDKVARALHLPYPGGPHIDRLAKQGKPIIPLPRALMDEPYDFSFSGLKSAVINTLHNAARRSEVIKKEDMAASFQEAVVDVLVEKTFRAIVDKDIKHLVLAGGVAANSELRRRLTEKANELDVSLTIPPLSLCTDNAAMIASVAYYAYIKGKWSQLDLNSIASLPLSTNN